MMRNADRGFLDREGSMTNTPVEQGFPKTVRLRDGKEVALRVMNASDKQRILTFAGTLSENDLLFLRTDITNAAVVDDWIENIQRGNTVSLLALGGEEVAGYASVHREPARWTRRVGELRVNASPRFRGSGLGRALVFEAFELGKTLGLAKLCGMLTPEQHGARVAFERLGFVVEARFGGYVEDRSGHSHDMLLMSYDLTGFTDQTDAR
jgi:L-amino acid N-acyltransferase YncA